MPVSPLLPGLRRLLLGALPKLALSRLAGFLGRLRLPRALRVPVLRVFARITGADPTEAAGRLSDYRSLAEFFARPLREGARPVDGRAPLVWPCDGRIVTAGPLRGDRIDQVKGRPYHLADLVADAGLATVLAGGTQATIYLAPRDYHRVHAPFDADHLAVLHVPGRRYPVGPGARSSIFPLFAVNERVVFRFRLADGRPAVVVMVAAFNVGDIRRSVDPPCRVRRGDELGRFGFGSTTIVVVGPGGFAIAPVPGTPAVRMGTAVPRP